MTCVDITGAGATGRERVDGDDPIEAKELVDEAREISAVTAGDFEEELVGTGFSRELSSALGRGGGERRNCGCRSEEEPWTTLKGAAAGETSVSLKWTWWWEPATRGEVAAVWELREDEALVVRIGDGPGSLDLKDH